MEKKTYDELYLEFPNIEKKVIHTFISDCIQQGFAIYTTDNKNTRDHISILKYPEKIFLLKSKLFCHLVSLLLIISPIIFLFLIPVFCINVKAAILDKHFSVMYIPCLVAMIIICMLIHEFAHSILTLLFKGEIGEIAVKYKKKPPTLKIYARICGQSYIKPKYKLAIIYLAGILSHIFNIILSLTIISLFNHTFLIYMSRLYIIINIFFIICNMIPVSDTDGHKILKLYGRSSQ